MKPANLTAFLAVATLSLCAMPSIAMAQDNSSYPMVLSASNLDAMVQGRLLTSPVKPEKQNSIETVKLSYSATQSNEPVELNVDMTYDSGKVSVLVDDDLLSRIKGQPVVFDIAQRPVTEVVLKYDPPAKEPLMGGDAEGALYVRLSDTRRMAGKVAALTEFKIKSAIGDVTIPMSEVAGIKLHTSSDDKAVVILNNGDSVTGIPTLTGIELITDWGKAEIEPEFIQSITSTSGAKFRQTNTDFGVRWTLSTGNSMAPGSLGN